MTKNLYNLHNLRKGDRFNAISYKHKHPHRFNPFTVKRIVQRQYVRALSDAGGIFELHLRDWHFEKVENDKTTSKPNPAGPRP